MEETKAFSYKSFDETLTVFPRLNMYRDNDNLYVGLDYVDEEYHMTAPYCDLTVNILPLPYLESAIDITYGMTDKLQFLAETGLAEPVPNKVLRSGFCAFPVYKFNEDMLREIDPDTFEKYAKAYGIDPNKKPALDTQIETAKAKGQNAAGEEKEVLER